MELKAHFYTGASPCMCALRGRQPGHLKVRAVLRHFVPYKELRPFAPLFAAIPADFAEGIICFQQTVPAAKSETPILSARPSTENVGGLFLSHLSYPSHQKEVMYYAETENHPRTEGRDR